MHFVEELFLLIKAFAQLINFLALPPHLESEAFDLILYTGRALRLARVSRGRRRDCGKSHGASQ